mmetsp:Transcript_13618/g.29318  ORF Transcript_13618/g.29318 Transcript_13618/m.29318 type:complete len:136 (-) Transcript_13618:1971-2378(-)
MQLKVSQYTHEFKYAQISKTTSTATARLFNQSVWLEKHIANLTSQTLFRPDSSHPHTTLRCCNNLLPLSTFVKKNYVTTYLNRTHNFTSPVALLHILPNENAYSVTNHLFHIQQLTGERKVYEWNVPLPVFLRRT